MKDEKLLKICNLLEERKNDKNQVIELLKDAENIISVKILASEKLNKEEREVYMDFLKISFKNFTTPLSVYYSNLLSFEDIKKERDNFIKGIQDFLKDENKFPKL